MPMHFNWIMNYIVICLTFASLQTPFETKVFKSIKIGAKNGQELAGEIKSNGMIIGEWTKDVLNQKFPVGIKEQRINLVAVSVEDLGFRRGARRDEIYSRAKALGFELCPSEVGPQLRLQHLDQPLYEWLVIGMRPITSSDGGFGIFLVGHGHRGIYLIGYYGDEDYFWDKDSRFVFVQQQKSR